MSNENAKELLEKYQAGQATDEERALVESWFLTLKDENGIPAPQKIQQMSDDIWASLPLHQAKVRRLWPRIAVAASILLMLSAGGYFLINKEKPSQTAEVVTQDIAPGTNHAILKIGHGKSVILDNSGKGLIAQQGGTAIHKTADGAIAYNGAYAYAETPVYDTLIVPAGSKPYRLTLADGSKVLVNAASRISYPESFGKKERQINLIDGEAYFEVTHNADRPLSVAVKGQMIEDIGTQFNINAYSDEPVVITSLVEGSVKVIKGSDSRTLIPGQQALVKNASNKIIVSLADLDEATAWKDGMFRFSGASLESIMRQVSRWYDVQVVYQDEALKSKHFSAFSTRFGMVSKLLHNLELTGEVKFKIEDNKITVLNK